MLRVTASDRASNPRDYKSTERMVAPITLANKPPTLVASEKTVVINADKTITIEGTASHKIASVRAVQYRVDSGDWLSAEAKDGLFDSSTENFTINTVALTSGKHALEIQAVDEAGNQKSQTIEVTVK